MEAFAYAAPRTVAEAVALLQQPGARPLAGGTDLLAQMKEGRRRVPLVVDVKHIPELGRLEVDGSGVLHIGAAVPCSRIARHPVVRERLPALAYGVSLIGSWQIQNRASLGGNLCNASPAADGVPALLIYGAQALVAGPGGERLVPVAEFCTGPGRTVLQPGELLVELQVPLPPARSGAAYRRFTPRAEMDIAFVGVGAYLELDGEGRIAAARVALGAVAPRPILAPAAAAALVGRRPGPEVFAEAAEAAAGEAQPISDVRASAEYRRHLVRVLARRVLAEAAGQAAGGGVSVAG